MLGSFLGWSVVRKLYLDIKLLWQSSYFWVDDSVKSTRHVNGNLAVFLVGVSGRARAPCAPPLAAPLISSIGQQMLLLVLWDVLFWHKVNSFVSFTCSVQTCKQYLKLLNLRWQPRRCKMLAFCLWFGVVLINVKFSGCFWMSVLFWWNQELNYCFADDGDSWWSAAKNW